MIKIGPSFAEERKRKNLTIEEVAKATKIREEFLIAIEQGNFKSLPSSTYAYGFVRNYAKFLGLPVERSLALFRREFDERKEVEVLPKGFIRSSYSFPKFRVGRNTILISIVFVFVLAFLLYQYRSAILNPTLTVDEPKENEVINSLTVEIKGKTDPNSTLLIENQEVPIESNGKFIKKITVFPGSTTLNFRVENKFGRVTILKRNIKVLPNE